MYVHSILNIYSYTYICTKMYYISNNRIKVMTNVELISYIILRENVPTKYHRLVKWMFYILKPI
jgi:hypothetical protein